MVYVHVHKKNVTRVAIRKSKIAANYFHTLLKEATLLPSFQKLKPNYSITPIAGNMGK